MTTAASAPTSAAATAATADALAEYTRRRDLRAKERDALLARHYVLGNWRLAIAAAGVGAAVVAWGFGLFSGWWLVVPLTGSIILARIHDGAIQRLTYAERSVAYYDRGLARLQDRWAGQGPDGAPYASADHPYAADLDLFGQGSLFQLMCAARTRGGEERLADWLLGPAPPDVVATRQEAVRELQAALDLRERSALLGEDVRAATEPGALVDWALRQTIPGLIPARATAAACCVVVLGALASAAAGAGWLPVVVAVFATQAIDRTMRPRVREALRGLEGPARDLGILSALLALVEKQRFTSSALVAITAALSSSDGMPSARIGRLQRLDEYIAITSNEVFAIISRLVLWHTQFALAVEAWRERNGAEVVTWLDSLAEYEALQSLAGYAYEHAADPLPKMLDGPPCFTARAIRHPLLPRSVAVPNDIDLGSQARLVVVSGSNMSGKSTLLRAIGVNAVLALAGAPVAAGSLSLTPLSVGASIRTLDSLQGGVSRFYAEILRLKQITDMAIESPPVLFLLDEILHGTNSHDRLIGAEAIVRELLKREAIGLVTTHDLALARIVEDTALEAANMHFEDDLINGKIAFDYRLKPGVVTKSNAIDLMRAIGLEV